MQSRLTSALPIVVTDEALSARWVTPSPSLQFNIPVLLQILEQIVSNWKTSSQKYDFEIYSGEEKSFRLTEAMFEITPAFIHSLFSYIIFFFMIENGYHSLYHQLNRLNSEIKFHLPHEKPPKRPDLISKLWLVRNKSVAHWAATEKNDLDGSAGQAWGISCPLWDISRMSFGHSGLSRTNPSTGIAESSSDRVIPPIHEIHEICSSYLDMYDELYANYLAQLRAKMPVTLGSRKYFVPTQTSLSP